MLHDPQLINSSNLYLKITFVHGLQDIVLREMATHPILQSVLHIHSRTDDCLFFSFANTEDYLKILGSIFPTLLQLRSVSNLYIVEFGEKLHPLYIHSHKSILGDMIGLVLALQPTKKFKTFKLRCAGSDSPEVQAIQTYISETFKLRTVTQAVAPTTSAGAGAGTDLDIYIHKPDALWEVGVRLTPRPLSVRDYKIEHIKGGINPTVAYAMNTFAFSYILSRTPLQPLLTSTSSLDGDTQTNFSYLNICSGSATLLIEARLQFAKLQESAKSGGAEVSATSTNGHFLGFDIDKRTNSQAIHNIQNAGLIKDIQIKTADLLDKPDFGNKGEVTGTNEGKNETSKSDIIASDLPFGMQVGKGDDLDKLYKTFVEYTTEKLKEDGVLVVYTTEVDTFGKALRGSAFTIDKTVSLKLTTSVGSIIQPKIFVCSRK